MLTLTISNKKPKPVPVVYTPPTTTYHGGYGTTPYVSPVAVSAYEQLAKDRDKIIKDLYDKCPYKVNDVCTPKQSEEQEKWGDITVKHISKNYREFNPAENKWPDNDNPMIVYGWSHKTQSHLVCTTDYLKKK